MKYGENWHACDFYYDHNINIDNNSDNWYYYVYNQFRHADCGKRSKLN